MQIANGNRNVAGAQQWLAANEDSLRAWGITGVRVVVGLVFLMHGWQKLFIFGLEGVIATFGQFGLPLPMVTAPLVTFLELIGGAALILGLLSRPLALLFVIQFIVAVFVVHLPGGFFLPTGIEFALTLLAGSLLILLGGGGAAAVDNVLLRRK